MTIDERRKYLVRMRQRYVKADRKERGRLLDEMEAVTELHRKSLLRLLSGDMTRQTRRRKRGRKYGAAMDDALRVIAESFDYVCPERLAPNLVWMARQLAAHGELAVSEELIRQLDTVSVSTVRRVLDRLGQDQPRLPRKGPERANQVLREVPMKRIPWNTVEPGHLETDLVHHCGREPSGEYVHTVQLLDVATGWSERVAVLGRGYLVMEAGFRRCLARLPFVVVEVHPDNGSEFFNHHLFRFWREAVQHVTFSRSRPYQKNDNRFVEQKNSSLVRAYLGYDRLDSVTQTLALNELYDQMWIYYNLFQPVMHLAEKTLVACEGQYPRLKRRYDQAQTPFDRLCAAQAMSPERRQGLERLRDATNPRRLRQDIYERLERLQRLPGVQQEAPQDVHEILAAIAQLSPAVP